MAEDTDLGGPARAFPDTCWTLILAARGDDERRRAALEHVLASYWKPLYVHVRRRGLSVEAAKDAVQGFLAALVEGDGAFLARLDPARGRLRAYLKVGIDRFVRNLHEAAGAAKRGGGRGPLSLDALAEEAGSAERALAASDDLDPDLALDREWALGVMEGALARLRAELEGGARRGPFALVQSYFGLDGAAPPPYAEAAAAHRMTVPQLKSFLHRARRRFRDLVRAAVARTVSDPSEVDGEVDDLVRILAAGVGRDDAAAEGSRAASGEPGQPAREARAGRAASPPRAGSAAPTEAAPDGPP